MSLRDDATIIYVPSAYKTSAVALQKPISAGSVSSFTFARASTATRVNPSGLIEDVATNLPRIDYSGGGCGYQLFEPARTNLITYSEEFDNAAWIKGNVSVNANVVSAPDGETTADEIISTTTTPSSQTSIAQTASTTGDIVISIYAKYKTVPFLIVRNLGTGGVIRAFNIQNGTLGSTTYPTTTDSEIEELANGWYRCIVKMNVSTVGQTIFYISSNGNANYTPTLTDAMYLWGTQFEAGAYDTSYIPTVASTVTRAVETMTQTGLATQLGDATGTLYVKASFLDITTAQTISISDATANNRVSIGVTGGNVTLQVVIAGTPVALFTTAATVGTVYAMAIAYQVNDFEGVVNGVAIGTDNTGPVFAPGILTDYDNDNAGGSETFYGKLYAVETYEDRLTSAQLLELTS